MRSLDELYATRATGIWSPTPDEVRAIMAVDKSLRDADLNGATLYGANLARANLTRANLNGATLTDANLTDANLNGAHGIVVLGPLGSRRDMLYIVKHAATLMVKAGCFWGTSAEFLAAVEKTHGTNRHAIAYRAAIALAEVALNTEEE